MICFNISSFIGKFSTKNARNSFMHNLASRRLQLLLRLANYHQLLFSWSRLHWSPLDSCCWSKAGGSSGDLVGCLQQVPKAGDHARHTAATWALRERTQPCSPHSGNFNHRTHGLCFQNLHWLRRTHGIYISLLIPLLASPAYSLKSIFSIHCLEA